MTILEFKIKLLPLKNRMFKLAIILLGNSDDAEDAVQESFVKMWNMQEKLNNIKNHQAFALTITRNYCLDKLKSKRNKHITLNEDITQYTNSTPYETTEQLDLVKNVKEVIKKLPQQQRLIVHLRDIEGHNFEEIMEITGWELNYVRVNLSRGRKKIKETITKMHHYERA